MGFGCGRARERLSQFGESREDEASLGFEPTSFGARETVRGQLELPEVLEGCQRSREALAQARCQWAERRGRRVWAYERQGVRESCLARRGVFGGAQVAHKRHGLAHAQIMTTHAIQDRILVFVSQAGQGVRQRRADVPRVDGQPGVGRKPSRKGEASHHPVGLSPKLPRDRLLSQLVVEAQRSHDPRLVQDRQSPGRRVGCQQRGLGVAQARQAFDHHGDVRGPLAAPALQALEAVEDLVGSVLARPDAQGELGKPTSAALHTALPQGGKARPESSDWDPQHLGGGRERLRAVLGTDRPRSALFKCVCH